MNVPDERKDGADFVNFAEYPIALIGDRNARSQDEIEHADTVVDPRSGKDIVRKMTVQAHPKHGLPTALDDDVLVGLLKISVDTGFSGPTMKFVPKDFLKLLGWPIKGQSFNRLRDSLIRWQETTLVYQNAWWNPAGAAWMNERIKVIDRVSMSEKRGAGHVLCGVTWTDIVFRSLRAGHWKPLDTRLYFSLKSPVSRRLMRFCDIRFRNNQGVSIGLAELAHDKIGLTGSYPPSKIKSILEPAILELMEHGFLDRLKTDDLYDKVNRSHWRIRLSGPSGPPPAPPHPLVAELIDRGVVPEIARALVQDYPEERVQRQIDHFDWRVKKKIGMHSPGGWLRAAVVGDYPLPDGYRKEQKRETQKELEFVDTQQRRQDRESDQKVRDFIHNLTPEEKRRMEQEALAALSESDRMEFERDLPVVKKGKLATILREYVQGRIR